MKTGAGQALVEVRVDHARLDDRIAIAEIDLQISRIRVSTIITPPPTGRPPPARLVPAPRGTNGTPSSLQNFTTAATSAVDLRKHRHARAMFFDHERVALVNGQIGMRIQNVIRTDKPAQRRT